MLDWKLVAMLPQLSVCGQICCGKNLLSLSCCCKLQKFVGMMSHSTVLLSDLYQHSTLVTYYIRHCHTVFLAIYSPLGAETHSLNLPFHSLLYSFGGRGLMTQHHVDLCALWQRERVGMWRCCGQGQYGNAWLFGSAHKLHSL